MGRCMNRECNAELFKERRDIMEKVYINPYYDTKYNLYENFIELLH